MTPELEKELFCAIYGIMIDVKFADFTDQQMFDFVEKVLFHYKRNHDVKTGRVDVKAELRKIQRGIEGDRFTLENIQTLIEKI